MKDGNLRDELVKVSRLAQERGLIVATDGNASALTDRGTVLITPSGIRKDILRPAQVVEMDLSGRLVAGRLRPSSEFRLHLAAYRARPDVRSVIHLHPCISVALAIAGVRVRTDMVPRETLCGLAKVPVVRFAPPGSVALATAAARALRSSVGALLDRHGSVTVGLNPVEAYNRAEKIEQLAALTLLTLVTSNVGPGRRR
ncbi:MAG: class II aldolase/adducin family protein [Planctomycetota bacterium]|nr:class II aldolase/adducin family protein [Planctomycetota bacterium]